MLKIRLALCAIIGWLNFGWSQVTVLDQSLLTQNSFDTFTAVSVTGPQTWNFNQTYGAVCSGYSGGSSYENQDWLISPAMDLSQTANATLTFSHTRGSASVLNVGVAEGWYKVFATAAYTGDPATTNWIEVTGLNQNIPTAWQYVSSGTLAIPDAARSGQSRIAFRYTSSAVQSATWEIKNVKVAGEIQGGDMFKIVNWNTDWLGCTTFGPMDENLQINNVVLGIELMNADVYCLQEVSNSVSFPSIATIVSLLGSDQWGGAIVPVTTDDCDQRQGIIYRKSKVQFVSSAQLSTGNPSQGNSYYYNWSSGRFPAVYNLNLVAGSTLIPVTVVNIHAKAEDGDSASYDRRLGASESLKTILDGPAYNNKNVVLIGDFNDYLIGTSSTVCGCSLSPYNNFMGDVTHYFGVSQGIVAAGPVAHPLIENVILSNELAGNYIPASAVQEVSVAQTISDYFYTTSDHYPMSFYLGFPLLGLPDHDQQGGLSICPNPAQDVLVVTTAGADAHDVEIYDLRGRRVLTKADGSTIDVSGLSSGTYILKSDGKAARFVKK